MNLGLRIALCWIVGVAVTYCVLPKHLPHRPVDAYTSWGQGHNPGLHCPTGTIRFETEEGWFLECYRGSP